MAENPAVPFEVQPRCTSPPGRFEGLREFRFTQKELEVIGSVRHAGRGESDDPLSLLADVALAPPCGDHASCSRDWEACGWQQGSLGALQLQLQVLLNKAHVLQSALVGGHSHNETEDHAATVRRFLFSCQPYFNLLEFEARNTESGFTSLPFDVYTQYVDFSQQLGDTLKQLVLTCASYNLLCLDDSKPHSLPYFAIGQTFVGRLRLSTFVYCRPMPFLAHVDTGLYKCMRWNVDRLGDDTDEDTEYYFLCYEDVPSTDVEADGDGLGASAVRMWSIGRWVQLTPNPNSDDIIDWILCKVPQASYQKLLSVGSEEPSSWGATDLLLQLLWYTEGHLDLQECVCLHNGAHDVCVESTAGGVSTDHTGQSPSSSS